MGPQCPLRGWKRERGLVPLSLVVLLCVLLGVLVAILFNAPFTWDRAPADPAAGEKQAAPAQPEGPQPEQGHPDRERLSAEALVRLSNKARAENGAAPLREDGLLTAIAEERARDMLKKQYFAHVAPDGDSYPDVARRVGYRYRCLSENIAAGDFLTNQKLIDGWMQSPGHRKNLLSPDVDEIGIAVVRGNLKGQEAYVAVQIFGLPAPEGLQTAPVSPSCTAPPADLAQAIENGRREIEDMERRLSSMKTEIDLEKMALERRVEVSKEEAERFNGRVAQYNSLVTQGRERTARLQRMIGDYNASIERYNRCLEGARTAGPS